MRLLFLIISLLIFSQSFSQGFKVKEFKQNLSDGSAFHAPMDLEGHPCGLVKIRSDNPDLQFKGDIVGEVENKTNEYWVYVSHSCRQLEICHPNFMPRFVSFSDYGIEISPKATYILTLEETKFKKEKTEVIIVSKPENANLNIDDISIDNQNKNGLYQLYLPKGEYVFKLSKPGYRPQVQIVQTGKGPQSFNIELESITAELEVMCKTVTAEIYIDGELKGNGTWKGNLLAGEHLIEARQKNCSTYKKRIILEEKEKLKHSIPELIRSMGKLSIETVPSGIFLSVDGEPVGTSPCNHVTNTGHHIIKGEGYGCQPATEEVEVDGGDNPSHSSLRLQIVGNPFFEKDNLFIGLDGISHYHFNYESQSFNFDHRNVYTKAYKGEKTYIKELAMRCLVSGEYDESYYREALYWMDRLPDLDAFINMCKEHWELAQGVVKAYCFISQPDKALKICETIGGEFQDFTVYGIIGKTYQNEEEYNKAILCYRKSDWYYEEIADCYVKIGKCPQAINYYNKKLERKTTSDEDIIRINKKLKELGY